MITYPEGFSIGTGLEGSVPRRAWHLMGAGNGRGGRMKRPFSLAESVRTENIPVHSMTSEESTRDGVRPELHARESWEDETASASRPRNTHANFGFSQAVSGTPWRRGATVFWSVEKSRYFDVDWRCRNCARLQNEREIVNPRFIRKYKP